MMHMIRAAIPSGLLPKYLTGFRSVFSTFTGNSSLATEA